MKGKPICLVMNYQKVKFPRLRGLEEAPMASILKRVVIERRTYFNKVDLCGILPYQRMYPHKCGIKINFDILTTQKDQ